MSTLKVSAVAFASATALAALCQQPARSQSFEIEAGQTSGPKTMAGENDTGTVWTGGSIDATGGDAVQMFNSGQGFTNYGSVATSANGAAGVNSQGDAAGIANYGLVRATGDGSAGIIAGGSGAAVENNGTIAVSGIGDAGIIGSGANLSVSNSGSITVDGEAAAGIVWHNNGLQVDNSGSVVVSGLASIGIGAGGNDVVIDNSGLVQATGDAAIGIGSAFGTAVINNDGSVVVSGASTVGVLASGDSAVVGNAGSVQVSGEHTVGVGVTSAAAVVTNAGSIVATGTDNIALAGLGNGTTVTNSGSIISDQGFAALYFGGSDATLNLLAGTAIQGPIVFADTGNTATFGPGLNAVMTFSGTGLPQTVLTGGRPFVVAGNTVAVLDITGFASAGAVVQDLTGGVAGAVETHLSAGRADGDAGHSSHAWITPFGVERVQTASGPAAGFSDGLGGIVAGADTALAADIRVGAFMGAAGGSTSVDGYAQDITHRSVFGGGYLAYDTGARFADVSLAFGRLDESSRRRVANNLVLGGVQMAQADYNGTFVSPALTLGARMPYGTGTLIPSLRLRYAGLFLGDYAETGAADALAVAGRDIHLFDARAQLALATAPLTTRSGVWQATWRVGLDGSARSADDVSATLLGQDIIFGDGSRKGTLRGFVGANLSMSAGNGMTFGGDVETSYGSDKAFIVTTQAHLDIAF
ncbi:MAG: autotransporter domain-containing protein [Mesorhizobium sp.]|nr:autotransporter outer membrane beta-barrel domain-containing protein [Mesorhizobium sp.]MBN9245360.1 autotransporter domain-containing protein [Mesorhizobium sp.]